MSITKAGRAPLIISCKQGDLTARTFHKNYLVELLSGVVLAVISICTVLYSFGISL